jgi:hypothetical protein
MYKIGSVLATNQYQAHIHNLATVSHVSISSIDERKTITAATPRSYEIAGHRL